MQPESKKIVFFRNWVFKVKIDNIEPNEYVCLTGNCKNLGNWIPEECVFMNPGTDDRNLWYKEVDIPSHIIRYRYFVADIVREGTQIIIKHWENHKKGRYIFVRSKTFPSEPDYYGRFSDKLWIERGWLTQESLIEFQFFGKSFTIWNPKRRNNPYQIKITATSMIRMSSTSETDDVDMIRQPEEYKFSNVEVSVLNSDDPTFKKQPPYGVEFKEDDMIIFRITLSQPDITAFLFDIYSTKINKLDQPHHAGFSYLLPAAFSSTEGECVLTLSTVYKSPLGELRVEYLIIHPNSCNQCTMNKTYSKHWNENITGLNIGHRGAGISFVRESERRACIRENTLASLKKAIEHGADFVEFDVQLSKDNVPIIYHDFTVDIAMRRKVPLDEEDLLQVDIKDLSLDQLRLLKLYNIQETASTRKLADEGDDEPFPCLSDALLQLAPEVGFDIEIKKPSQYKDGSWEATPTLEINQYVDIILQVIFEQGSNRRIVLTSFNPNICAAIKLKQNKYPIMFLTQGVTNKYTEYRDPRCKNISCACQFAKMINLLGISVNSENLLADMSYVQYIKDRQLILFCWGDDNYYPENVQKFKDLGVQGIIYDKIYLTNERTNTIFQMHPPDSDTSLEIGILSGDIVGKRIGVLSRESRDNTR